MAIFKDIQSAELNKGLRPHVVFSNSDTEQSFYLHFYNKFVQVKHGFKSTANLHLHKCQLPTRSKAEDLFLQNTSLLESLSLLQVTFNPLCFLACPLIQNNARIIKSSALSRTAPWELFNTTTNQITQSITQCLFSGLSLYYEPFI